MACSSKISFDLRSPEIFEELENLHRCFCRVFVYPLRHSKLKISISQFSLKIDPYFT
jgi:hypothetical protein